MAVAVIGAGVSGLACAGALAERGVEVTVFDKGRRVGGRMNRRSLDGYEFDHGAQYLTARDSGFSRLVDQCLDGGVLDWWSFRVRDDRGSTEEMRRLVGHGSMRRLAEFMAQGLSVRLETRVAPIEGSTLFDDHGGELGQYDVVVVTAPLEQARSLVAASPELMTAMGEAGHDPCWCVMAGWSSPLSIDVEVFRDVGPFSWVAKNSAKPGRPSNEAWVLHATPEWSLTHLEDDAKQVAGSLLEAFESIVGSLPPPEVVAAHRWRYARTRAPVGTPCLVDQARRLIVAGDGLLGPRIESAWLSGVAAAHAVLEG